MNLKAPYEIIIAKKLEQELPVPDLSDAIWVRIELQLGDVPSAEGDSSAGPDMIAGATITGKTLAIVIGGLLSLLVLFFVLKNKIKNQQKLKVPPPAQQLNKIIYPPPTDRSSGKVNAAKTTTIQKIEPTAKDLLKVEDAGVLKQDTANLVPPVLQKPDPFFTIAQPARQGKPDSLIQSPLLRGPRGVPLSVNDGYKITNKPGDSLKPKN